MPCGWAGNRRSGVALAMRHRLQWFIHLRAQGLRKGDEPTLLIGYTVYGTLYLRMWADKQSVQKVGLIPTFVKPLPLTRMPSNFPKTH